MAAYSRGKQVLCIQPHPEFVEDYSDFLLDKRRAKLGEEQYQAFTKSLAKSHDGLVVARMMVAFINQEP